MNILFISHRIPYPPNKGDKIRSYHLLKHLSSKHRVSLATLYDTSEDQQYIYNLKNMVENICYERIISIIKKFYSLSAVFRNTSFSNLYFYSNKLQKKIDFLLKINRFDIIYCFSSPTAEYYFKSKILNSISRPHLIMDLVDVDSAKWLLYSNRSRGFKKKIYAYEAEKNKIYENKIINIFDKITLVSDEEKEILNAECPNNKICVVKNGVDNEFFNSQYSNKSIVEYPYIVFIGQMDYMPNIDAVIWFSKKVFPYIEKSNKTIKFIIVGNNPANAVKKLNKNKNIHITGYVNDVRPYLRGAEVVVVPLRIARGIQNKILEAFAMGKAVVCTPQALEGINATPGKEIIVSSDEISFANCIIELIKNKKKAALIGKNAKEFVDLEFSWKHSYKKIDSIISSFA